MFNAPIQKALHLALMLICLPAYAADVTSSMVNLGNGPNLAGASNKPSRLSQMITYKNRVYMGGTTNGGRQSIVYYDPASSSFKVERNADGSQLVAWAEKITGFQNADNDLLVAGDDGSPNDKTGLHINDASGWRFVQTPYDNIHGHTQYKFKGKFFATFLHNPNYGGSPEKGPGIVVSKDNLRSWQIVGDPENEFSIKKARNSHSLHEIRGQLFSTGYYSPGGPVDATGWLTHYTGDATDSFETVYSTSGNYSSTLNGFGYAPIAETMDLGGNKGILLTGTRYALRFRLENAVGRNGTYLKPVNESTVSSTAKDLLKWRGTGYILEHSGTTAKVRWSQDMSTWTTLFTCSLSDASAIEIHGGNFYIVSGMNLYRIPGSSFGGLPESNNIAPIANANSFAAKSGFPLVIPGGSSGVLPNDLDANSDNLVATLVSGPSHGTLVFEANGQFTYTSDSGFTGTDTFVYSASDGLASSNATVTLTVGPAPLPTEINGTGNILFGDDQQGDALQDSSNSLTSPVTISADRRSARIVGNPWKRFPLNYVITPNTLLEFTVNSSDTGEILAIILDDNTAANDDRRGFVIGGQDRSNTVDDNWVWNVSDMVYYNKGQGAKTYTIPVGIYFTGQMNYLVLVGDDDSFAGSTDATFSNLRLSEITPQTYAAWKSGIAWGAVPESQRGPDADPDGDGRDNKAEHAFGGSPTVAESNRTGETTITKNSDSTRTFKILYKKAAQGMNYVMQHSTNLAIWTDDTSGAELFEPTNGLHYRRWTAPLGQTRSFTRIIVR